MYSTEREQKIKDVKKDMMRSMEKGKISCHFEYNFI